MLALEIKPVLTWVTANPEWAGLATFLVAFLESLALVGLLIPGTVVMTAIGALVGMGYLPVLTTLLWAAAGALAGDVISFWLGYSFHSRVRDIWPIRSYPNLLKTGENFFQKHGGKSIFLGRFVGPVRPVLPLIAGTMFMPPLRFITVDILSAIVWSPSYMLPGILLGAASQELAPATATRVILIVIAALLILWGISWLLKRSYAWLTELLDRTLAQVWQIIRTRSCFRFIHIMLKDPTHRQSHSQLSLALIAVMAAIALAVLVWNVIHHGILTSWNEAFFHLLRSLRATGVDRIMILITFIGEKPVILSLWLGVLIWLSIIRKYRWAALHWLAIGILTIVGGSILKHWVHSARPVGIILSPTGWSFPSGHVIFSVSFFGFLAILIARNWKPHWRWLAYVVAGFISLSVMFSRVYLGAHWLTDILGGFLYGLLCIALVTISYRRKLTPTVATAGVISVALVTLIIAWSLFTATHFKEAIRAYTPYWPTYKIDVSAWWTQEYQPEPFYRTNRFGKPIQVFNIQWAGNLTQIEQVLTLQGWYKLRPSLTQALKGITHRSNTVQPFLVSQLYEDKHAVLVMAKIINKNPDILLILHLWDTNATLSNGQPLWVGTLAYHQPWDLRFLNTNKDTNNKALLPLPAVSQILTHDLTNSLFMWKKVIYTPNPSPLYTTANLNWDGTRIFIQPNN